MGTRIWILLFRLLAVVKARQYLPSALPRLSTNGFILFGLPNPQAEIYLNLET